MSLQSAFLRLRYWCIPVLCLLLLFVWYFRQEPAHTHKQTAPAADTPVTIRQEETSRSSDDDVQYNWHVEHNLELANPTPRIKAPPPMAGTAVKLGPLTIVVPSQYTLTKQAGKWGDGIAIEISEVADNTRQYKLWYMNESYNHPDINYRVNLLNGASLRYIKNVFQFSKRFETDLEMVQLIHGLKPSDVVAGKAPWTPREIKGMIIIKSGQILPAVELDCPEVTIIRYETNHKSIKRGTIFDSTGTYRGVVALWTLGPDKTANVPDLTPIYDQLYAQSAFEKLEMKAP